jgi:phospholipase D3/4
MILAFRGSCLVFGFFLLLAQLSGCRADYYCDPPVIVETLPYGIRWPNLPNISASVTTFASWKNILMNTAYTLDIAAMYITLNDGLNWPSAAGGALGAQIFQEIVNACKRGVKIRIIVNVPTDAEWVADLQLLKQYPNIEILEVDWNKMTKGNGGILHTKLMIADDKVAYFGSANFDWRSLSQVKELGLVTSNCPPILADLSKIYEIYWMCARNSSCPSNGFPRALDTLYNETYPMHIYFTNRSAAHVFIASGPKMLTTPSRSSDADAIIHIINNAEVFVHASVMEYSPKSLYNKPPNYWTDLDTALRAAALRGVNISILASLWNHSDMSTIQYLQSLDVLSNIEVRLIKLPDNEWSIPFTRVNHCKYLVTESAYYITTSNWTPDYFLQTGGISMTIESTEDAPSFDWPRMNAIFLYDWNNVTNFTYHISHFFPLKFHQSRI